ncbi:MAG TPA: DUF929 family protein [Actinopolymorphaceae bacterium]|nr:DUF929 family protein [Actinopolymorphaceae bacterium]
MTRSKAQRRKSREESTRAKVEAMRAEQAAKERRRRLLVSGGAVLGVLVVVAAIVLVSVFGGGGKPAASGGGGGKAAQGGSTVPAGVLRDVTSVPPATLDAIGKGTALSLPKAVKGTPLAAGGKPQILYVGAEYCPYCAAERWSMVVALSRFGSLHDVGATHSASEDVFPNTPTFTFHGSSYDSDYVSFVGKELNTNERQGNGYKPLDKLSDAEQAQFSKLTGGQQSFPFIDVAGKYVVSGVQFDPKVLQGKSMSQIAAALKDKNDPVAKAVNGTANTLTAAICDASGGKPANVCSSPAVTKLRSQLHAAD